MCQDEKVDMLLKDVKWAMIVIVRYERLKLKISGCCCARFDTRKGNCL
jgi:hypothetical protein